MLRASISVAFPGPPLVSAKFWSNNLKELAKDIFSKQVEPLSYATIYKYIADHYGYRTWKDFKKILESK